MKPGEIITKQNSDINLNDNSQSIILKVSNSLWLCDFRVNCSAKSEQNSEPFGLVSCTPESWQA